jgi:hypothetical protein
VEFCAIYENVVSAVGGGVAIASGASLNVYNSTLYNNTANTLGGGVWSDGTTTLDYVTFSGNYGSGADSLGAMNGQVSMRNTIFTHTGGSTACYTMGAPFLTQGWNLDTDNSCSLVAGTDLPGVPAGLLPCGGYGTVTEICPLQVPGSPALDSGSSPPLNSPPGSPIDRDQIFSVRSFGAGFDRGAREGGDPASDNPTLIELASFTATAADGGVRVEWQTVSEVDNAGFNLYRSEAADGEYVKLNAALIPAQGDPAQGASYAFDDTDVVPGTTYYYKLEDVDLFGVGTFHGPVSVEVGEMPTSVDVLGFATSRVSALAPMAALALGVGGLAWTWRRKRR